MTEAIRPPWESNQSTPSRGNPTWTPGMKSPNPSGRPKGIKDRRQKLQQAFADDANKLIRVVLDAALEGDMQAANIALARIAPPLKAQTERVQFELDPDRSTAEQAQQVMDAIAAGEVDPDTGKMLIDCLRSVAGIKATEELEQRIIMLEAKAI